MSNRREALRIAGWVAVVFGLGLLALGLLSKETWTEAVGAYGLLFLLTGAWAVGGLVLVSRYERRAAGAQTASRVVPDSRETISR